MTAKVRVLTRRFDLSVEGDNSEEVEHLIVMLGERGLFPIASGAAGDVTDASTPNGSASTKSVSDSNEGEVLLDGTTGPLETFGQTDSPISRQDAGPIRAVTKRSGDVFVLSPKFPPAADGAERVEDAALVLLGAFDATGEGAVTGYRLIVALRQTGYTLARVDTKVEALTQRGLVLVEGKHRGRRYALSESGRAEARRLAGDLAALAGKAVEPGA